MYYIYVIQCDIGKLYIGSTDNIEKRLDQHNQGISEWTSKYHNWKLIYHEEFKTRKDALLREKFLKKQKGGDVLKRIIESGS
jgi:putative endonuclease